MVTRGHYEIGIEGLALLRAGTTGDGRSAGKRTAEIAAILRELGTPPYSEPRTLPRQETNAGYAGWAASYDEPGNDTIALEEPAVRALLDGLPEGPVLDAACGTGRHAAYLAATGRKVIGVDASEAMLEQARHKLPDVELRQGELTSLPLRDASVAGAVCALALSHLPELRPAIEELARVLQPGGRLVISNPHPLATGVLNWRAVYDAPDGRRTEIREYPHLHGSYVSAFGAAGLTVRHLVEPTLTSEDARRRAKLGREEAFERALTGIPAVIVWEVERTPRVQVD